MFLVLTQVLALTVPRLLRTATDALVASDLQTVGAVATQLVVVAIASAVTRILSRVLIFNSGRRVEFDIRNDLFAHLEKMTPSFYAKMPVGQVMSRMVNDLTQVRLLLGPGLLNLTNTTIVYIVALPLLLAADAELALIALSPLPILLLLGRAFSKRLYEYSIEGQERLAALSSKVQENLTGAMTVRAYRRELDEQASFAKLNDHYLEVNMKLARVRGTMFPLMGLSGAVATIVVLWLGGHRIADGRMTVGRFVEFNGYLAALTWPTIALGWMISLWQRGLASMKRINDIFQAEPSIVDGTSTPAPLSGAIEIKSLTVTYPKASRASLENVNVTLRAGQTIVIVGPTGAGKSTLLKAIARLLEVPRGSVYFDGIDVLDLPLSHVRGAISYAPQEAFLFSRTIFENVAFGRPDADDPQVLESVRAANLSHDLNTFPEGLDTLVGERGITLSGGQRQRTALARAFLIDAKILLLDDSLAAVDTETETRIIAELDKRRGRHTTIIASHRLAIAQHADHILVLDGGRLTEEGTEAELLALGGEYAKMHRRQRLEHALEVEAAVEASAAGVAS